MECYHYLPYKVFLGPQLEDGIIQFRASYVNILKGSPWGWEDEEATIMYFKLELEAIMEEADLLFEEKNVLADILTKDFLACKGYCEHEDNPLFMHAISRLESKGLKERLISATNKSLSGYTDSPMLEEGIANEY